MTDLGNGLFAVSVPDKSVKFYFVNSDTKYLCFFGADIDNVRLGVSTLDNYEMLGTVTKLKIYFDYKTETGLGTFDFYELLSSKGLLFVNPIRNPNVYGTSKLLWQQYENNLIEKLVIIKKV